MYTGLHVKYPLFLSDCNETYILLTDFINNTQISKLLKIRPMGAQFFHADGWTDGRTNGHDEAKSRFWQLCERAHKLTLLSTLSTLSTICTWGLVFTCLTEVFPEPADKFSTESWTRPQVFPSIFIPVNYPLICHSVRRDGLQ